MTIRPEIENLASCFRAAAHSRHETEYSLVQRAGAIYKEVFGKLAGPLTLTEEEGDFMKRVLLEASGSIKLETNISAHFGAYVAKNYKKLVEDDFRLPELVKFPASQNG